MKKIHIHKNGRVGAEIYTSKNDRFFCFLRNEKNIGTTLAKRDINCIDTPYTTIEFERITIPCRSYIYYSDKTIKFNI